ncbi:hypothetical protein FHG89_08825 [Micromonospora orduensis]|uniref:Uncharacterized protein n=1 Tax=Micromonospora orduensis TaxID=1420891 RepID=A0A5C4QVZ3_9ACTN|nr:hypothetical protein [Micromonospora orduensis]TNH30231.1 hypothetical protein FHG89_08825 [Micromonospora orduensis]
MDGQVGVGDLDRDGLAGVGSAERDFLPDDHDHAGVRRPALNGHWSGCWLWWWTGWANRVEVTDQRSQSAAVTGDWSKRAARGAVDRADDAYHEPMIEQSQRRVPLPVAAASMTVLVAAALSATTIFTGGPFMATGLIGVLLLLALAFGLWRGSGRARFWTTVFSTLSVAYGIYAITQADASGLLQIVGASVIVGLLLVPASSRRWFHDLPAEG